MLHPFHYSTVFSLHLHNGTQLAYHSIVMGKCDACNKDVCEGQYENRDKCEESKNCTCACQESADETFLKGLGSVALGVAAFAGGIVLTATTGGLGVVGIAAVLVGGALSGAGATATIQPMAKKMSGERITVEEYAKDLVVGGTVGAVTGPITLGGAIATTSIASKVGSEGVKQGVVKLGCHAAVGAMSGATASAIQEGVDVVSEDEDEFSVANIFKGAALGAATGGAVNQVDMEVARSVCKVVSNTIDASCQKIDEGKVDVKKLATAATSAGFEAVVNLACKVHDGKDSLRNKLGDKKTLDRKSEMEAEQEVKNQLPLDEVHNSFSHQ